MYWNNNKYAQLLEKQMQKDLNIFTSLQGTFRNGIQNDTVADTPLGSYLKNYKNILVVVHNPNMKVNQQMVEIQVSNSAYAVSVWCSKSK